MPKGPDIGALIVWGACPLPAAVQLGQLLSIQSASCTRTV